MPAEEPKEKIENEEPSIEVSADKTKSVVILLIVLSVLVMALTPVVTIFVVRAMVPTTDAPSEKEINTNIKEISLDPFKVNIKETQGRRYAQVTVVLEVSNSNMEAYFKNKSKDAPDGMLNRFRAEISSIISDRNLSGLLSKDAKLMLAKEIKDRLNEMLEHKKVDGVVNYVYFPSFLVQ